MKLYQLHWTGSSKRFFQLFQAVFRRKMNIAWNRFGAKQEIIYRTQALHIHIHVFL